MELFPPLRSERRTETSESSINTQLEGSTTSITTSFPISAVEAEVDEEIGETFLENNLIDTNDLEDDPQHYTESISLVIQNETSKHSINSTISSIFPESDQTRSEVTSVDKGTNVKNDPFPFINLSFSASSHQNLFGAPAERSRPCVKRVVRVERDLPVRRTKPLPGNIL